METKTQKIGTVVGIVLGALAVVAAVGTVATLYINRAVAAENEDLVATVQAIQTEHTLMRQELETFETTVADNTKVVREFDTAFREYLLEQIRLAEERVRRAGQ